MVAVDDIKKFIDEEVKVNKREFEDVMVDVFVKFCDKLNSHVHSGKCKSLNDIVYYFDILKIKWIELVERCPEYPISETGFEDFFIENIGDCNLRKHLVSRQGRPHTLDDYWDEIKNSES